jgi:hypothetical protein
MYASHLRVVRALGSVSHALFGAAMGRGVAFGGSGGGATTAATEGTETGTVTGLAGVTGSFLSKTAKRCSKDLTSPMSMKKRIGR